MDLLTGYDTRTAARDHALGFGIGGARAASVIEQARCSRRPARSVFFDERGRTGDTRGPAGRGTYQSGLFGEEVVADGLIESGWRILGHRVRTKSGELDLVARRDDLIVFAEVKTARPGRIAVEDAVDARQRLRIRRAAVTWMAMHPHLQRGVRGYRFDVFLVRRDALGGVEQIDHVRNAF